MLSTRNTGNGTVAANSRNTRAVRYIVTATHGLFLHSEQTEYAGRGAVELATFM